MSIGWEEVLTLVDGEMVGGEMIVTEGRNVKVSFGKFTNGQFVFSVAGLEFIDKYKNAEAVSEQPAEAVEAIVETVVEDHPEAVTEAAPEPVQSTEPTLEELLG